MPIIGVYECKASHCLLRFQTKDELMSHIKKKHVVWTQKYENFCQECKILFKSDEDLKRHYQQDHPDKNTGASMIIDRDLVDHDQEIVQKLRVRVFYSLTLRLFEKAQRVKDILVPLKCLLLFQKK